MKGKKTGGRQKGSKNKIPGMNSIRSQLTNFVQNNALPKLVKQFNRLKPKDQLMFLTKILPFTTATYQSISFNLRDLPEQDLEFVLQKLKEDAQNEQPETNTNQQDSEFD